MSESQAISTFKSKFTMYANVELEAHKNNSQWDIYIKDSTLKVGYVALDGTPFLEPCFCS